MSGKIETIITAKDQASGVFKSFTANVIAMNQGLELANKAFRALAAPIASVVKEGREFNQQMATVRSISKITAEDFKKLSDEAERIGRTTVHTSAQAGKGMEELRRAGQGVNQILTTTGAVMDLVSAQGSEMGETAKLVAVQLNIFKDTGLEARKAVDLMNQTLSSSPMNFEELNYALQYASGTASAAGWDFQKLTATLGAMAEQGVTGGKAGTALNMALARLMKPTSEAQKALSKYGIAIDEINPSINDFADIVDVLNKKNVTQSDLFSILGVRTAPKFFKVIQAGGDAIRNFSEKQKGANTALDSARDRLDNIEGDITLFNSALSGLKISVFKGMDTALRGVTKTATNTINKLSELISQNKGPLTDAFNGLRKVLGYVLIGFGTLLKTISGFLQMEGVKSFFNDLGEVINTVWESVSNFIKKLKEYIDTSPNAQKAIENLKNMWSNLFKILGKVFSIIGKLASKLINLASKALKPVLDKLLPVYNLFMDFMNDILEKIIGVLDNVDKAFELPLLDSLQKLLDSVIKKWKELLKAFDDFSGFSDKVNKAEKAITDFDKANVKLVKSSKILTYLLGGMIKESKGLEDQLVTHSTVPAIQALADVSKKAGEEAITLGRSLLVTTDNAKKLEEQANKAGKAVSDMGGGVGSVDVGLGGLIDFDKIKDSIVEGFKAGAPKAIKVMAAVGQVVYNAIASAVSLISSAFSRNAKFQAALDKVTEAIDTVLSPLIEEFIPVVESVAKTLAKVLAPIVKAIMPVVKQLAASLAKFLPQLLRAIMPIVKEIIGRLLPVFVRLTEELMPVIIQLFEALGPIVSKILDILIPILQALNPLIKALLEIVIELLPIIELILDIIKVFLPIIIAAVRIVTLLVNIIKTLIQVIKVVGQFVYDGIKNGLIAGVAIALAPLFIVLKGIEATLNIIKTPIQIIGDILATLRDAINELISALSGGSGPGSNWSVTNPTGSGPVTGIPGSPFHTGGMVTQSDLTRLPGMATDEGLIRVKAGEEVLTEDQQSSQGGITLNFNINAIDPRESAEEIRQVIEELSLTGRLKLA